MAKVVETQTNLERQLELIETHQQEVFYFSKVFCLCWSSCQNVPGKTLSISHYWGDFQDFVNPFFGHNQKAESLI